MQAAAKTIRKLLDAPNHPPLCSLFHSTSLFLARSSSKSDASEPHIRFSVREKRPSAIKSLKNSLIDEYSPKHRMQDENSTAHDEDTGRRRKDIDHSNRKNSNRSCSGRGKHNAGKRWKSKKQLYNEDYDEQPKTTFTLNVDGQKSYTWSFGSLANFQSSTSDFKSSNDAKWEKAKKRIWNESDVEDETEETDGTEVGLHFHRVALGLPPTGPLKLDDVKCAFRTSALKWHPDKHQGPSRVTAEEKFKTCVDAYNSLCNALKSA